MRAFVAMDVPARVRKALARAQQSLAAAGAPVRWVDPRHLHLTLRFLGEIDEAGVGPLRAALCGAASPHAAFDLEVVGLGGFPPRRPRAIWAGCRGDVDRLSRLAADVSECAEALGVPAQERPFSPHITLGRVKKPGGARRVAAPIALAAAEPFGRWTVRAFGLYRSELTAAGPRYTLVHEFRLVTGH